METAVGFSLLLLCCGCPVWACGAWVDSAWPLDQQQHVSRECSAGSQAPAVPWEPWEAGPCDVSFDKLEGLSRWSPSCLAAPATRGTC